MRFSELVRLLEESGFRIVKEKGSIRYYGKARCDRLMDGCTRLLAEKRQEILDIAHRHGARNVRVFGSAARGDAVVGSDLDLLVSTAAETSPWFPSGLVSELEEALGCDVDVVTERRCVPAGPEDAGCRDLELLGL